MSLLNIREAGKQGKLGLWHISESIEELLKLKNFSAEDIKTLHSFSNESRKKEWLVARILTEKLSGNKDVQILYDEHNKPSLKNSQTKISLSHSHNYLAVILCENDTGIDIELVKPKIAIIRGKFMSPGELNALQKENQEEQLTVYWCAKEALYKLYGKKELAFKENLAIEPFQYAEKARPDEPFGRGIIRGWIKNAVINKCFSLQYEKLDLDNEPYILAYIINEV